MNAAILQDASPCFLCCDISVRQGPHWATHSIPSFVLIYQIVTQQLISTVPVTAVIRPLLPVNCFLLMDKNKILFYPGCNFNFNTDYNKENN